MAKTPYTTRKMSLPTDMPLMSVRFVLSVKFMAPKILMMPVWLMLSVMFIVAVKVVLLVRLMLSLMCVFPMKWVLCVIGMASVKLEPAVRLVLSVMGACLEDQWASHRLEPALLAYREKLCCESNSYRQRHLISHGTDVHTRIWKFISF